MGWLRNRVGVVVRSGRVWVSVAVGVVALAVLVFGGGRCLGVGIAGAGRNDEKGGVRVSESGASRGGEWFEESATSMGIAFRHVSVSDGGYLFPEIMGGGVCLFDFDGDGWLDVYFVQSGVLDSGAEGASGKTAYGNELYRNLGGGQFEDVTRAAGVGDSGYGMGCACGDFDGDGDEDLYVTNVGGNVLYRNNGDGTFADVSLAAGVADPAWSASAAFLDIDGDADLDLFVTNYVRWSVATDKACEHSTGKRMYCSPNSYSPAPDRLYRNNGDGTFSDDTEASGVGRAYGNGLGVSPGDFNGDGRVDIYVANDGMPNQLWLNRGDGTFENEALLSGTAVNADGKSEAGMGVQSVDIDHDGDVDLFLSHLRNESNTFYRNDGAWFEDATLTFGLAVGSIPFTGFGLGFSDFDHDGGWDLYVANGRVVRAGDMLTDADVYAEPNQLFTADGRGRFSEVLPRGGVSPELVHTSRGAGFGDFDNDGDIDVVVVNRDGPASVLRNVSDKRGHWVMFDLRDGSGRRAIGARVQVEAKLDGGASDRVWRRIVQPAYGYLTSNDPRVHFGLGDAGGMVHVRVDWLDGTVELFGPYRVDALYEIQQGTGASSMTAAP